jgi:hypothetical protein
MPNTHEAVCTNDAQICKIGVIDLSVNFIRYWKGK